jgi:hypothetical protein
MAAKELSLQQAYDFLYEILCPGDGLEIDADALKAQGPNNQEKSEDPKEKPRDFRLLGPVWEFGDVLPARPPMLIENILPAIGWGYIGGQWGTYKTFFTNALAVAVAGSPTFAGEVINRNGAVVVVELEGSDSEARITAAARALGIESKLPILVFSKAPPKAIANGILNPKFTAWMDELADCGKDYAKKRGVPLALITIDPQNKVAGFKNEDSSAEGQIVSDAWDHLSKAAGCTVVVVDHYGKSQESGLRGTSVKETTPNFIFGLSAKKKNYAEPRLFWVRKQKSGRDGVGAHFHMEDYDAQVVRKVTNSEDTETVTVMTLVMRWDDSLHQIEEDNSDNNNETPKKRPSQKQQCLNIIVELAGDKECRFRAEQSDAVGGYMVSKDICFEKAVERGVFSGTPKEQRNAWYAVLTNLRKAGLAESEHGFIWARAPTQEA